LLNNVWIFQFKHQISINKKHFFFILWHIQLISDHFPVEKSQVASVCHASKVLLHFLVERLSRVEAEDGQLARLLLLTIQGLCQGRATLQVADRLALTADMKVARLPGPSKATTQEKEAEPLKRPRSDLTAAILEQLTTPLSPSATVDAPEAGKEQTESESHSQFVRKNVASLKALNASDKILDVCLALVNLKPYLTRYFIMLLKF
jgi:hypothetical protein